jgi:hypothetical protein
VAYGRYLSGINTSKATGRSASGSIRSQSARAERGETRASENVPDTGVGACTREGRRPRKRQAVKEMGRRYDGAPA